MDTAVLAAIMESLTCVVCREVNLTSVNCKNGHPICMHCVTEVCYAAHSEECPVCRSKQGWSRNLALERVALASDARVRCDVDGCSRECRIGGLEEHRAMCSRRLFVCPVFGESCKHVLASELAEHVAGHKDVLRFADASSVLSVCLAMHSDEWQKVVLFNGSVVIINVSAAYQQHRVSALVMGGKVEQSRVFLCVKCFDLLDADRASVSCCEVPSSYDVRDARVVCELRSFGCQIDAEACGEACEFVCALGEVAVSPDVMRKRVGCCVAKRSKWDRVTHWAHTKEVAAMQISCSDKPFCL